MGVGRFLCVALPFGLTIASIVFLLIAALAGVTDKSLYLFRLDVEDLTIDPANLDNFVENLDINLKTRAKSENITGEELGLQKVYDISIWNYCYTDRKNKRHCVDAEFDWASKALNTSYIEHFGAGAGYDIELPDELTGALKVFRQVSKWTQVAFIMSFVALAVEIIIGLTANCSRIMSCITWIISTLAAILVICTAIMASFMGGAVVGAVKATAKFYGANAKLNNTFIIIVWFAAALALGAAIFWIFTICCCKPESRSRKNRKSDGEKLLGSNSGTYAPLGNDNEMTTGYYNNNQSQYGAPRSGAARSDLAYEPYSHRA